MGSEKFKWYALKLSLICVFIFLLGYSFPEVIFNNFVLVSSEVFTRPWGLVTYIFLHAGPEHLFFNLFALVLFGSILEKIIGYKKFLIVFFSAGIVSGIATVFFYNSTVGASGAIMGILGFLGAIRPKMIVPAMGIILPMVVAIALWAALDIIGIFSADHVAHWGHLGGLFFGIIVGLKLRGKYKIVKKKEEKVKISNEEFEEWERKYMQH